MNNLRTLRKQKGITQKVVADYIGISFQAYSRYENGYIKPDPDKLARLAEFFGVSIEFLDSQFPNIIGVTETRRLEENLMKKFTRHFIKNNTLDYFISKPIFKRIPALFSINSPDLSLVNENPYKVDLPFYYQEAGKPIFCFLYNEENIMSPDFLNGDLIIARNEYRIKDGDYVVVSINKEDAVIRKVISKGNKKFLDSNDSTIKAIEFVPSINLIFIGLVLERRSIKVHLNYLGYLDEENEKKTSD